MEDLGYKFSKKITSNLGRLKEILSEICTFRSSSEILPAFAKKITNFHPRMTELRTWGPPQTLFCTLTVVNFHSWPVNLPPSKVPL